MDCEDCRHLTMVGLHDTGPRSRHSSHCKLDALAATLPGGWRLRVNARLGLPSFSSLSVSAQDGTVALGKAHTRSAPSISGLAKVVLETLPVFVRLNTDRSRPRRVECQPPPFSTPFCLQAISAVMFWPGRVQKVSQASEHFCPAKHQTRCDTCPVSVWRDWVR